LQIPVNSPVISRNGPIYAEPKVPSAAGTARKQRTQVAEIEPKVVAQNMTQAELENQQSEATALAVYEMYQLLVDAVHASLKKRINFFKFLMNPKCFSNSVENVFYFSFLVRDGRAFLEESSSQPSELLVGVVSEDGALYEAADTPLQSSDRRHCLIEIDLEVWKKAVEVYEIKQPMIPTRNYSQ
jgi:hypothetical protein